MHNTLIAFARLFFEILKDLVFLPVLIAYALLYRGKKRPTQIGLGPGPLINNVYHKKALIQQGYTAETFVSCVYYITDEFDFRADLTYTGFFASRLPNHLLFLHAIKNYEMLYLYFTGGPLGAAPLLWRLEPLLYRLAGVKTLLMPYGADVQDMSRSPNLVFKHVMGIDYPTHGHKRVRIAHKIDLWTRYASHIISGVEWVDYMSHWDTLLSAHFSIDIERWTKKEPVNSDPAKPLRILHAPNHRNLKGTDFFIQAVNELKEEGLDIELKLMEGMPNHEVMKAVEWADMIADQLIVGWYAMFALEAMSMERPVLCYLRDDLYSLYSNFALEPGDEIPILRCGIDTVKDVIAKAYAERPTLPEVGAASRKFAEKYHSTEFIGTIFKGINVSLDIKPAGE